MFVNFFAETINKIYSLNKKEDDIDHVEYTFKNTTCRDEFEIFKKSMMMFYDNNYKDAFEIDTSIKIFFKDGTYLKRDHDDKTEFWTLERP